MNSQQLQVEPPKISKRVKAITIGGITLMCALIFVAVVAYCYNYYPDQITPELEFTMRKGDRREVRDTNLVIELSDIRDDRCSAKDGITCFWQGEVKYVFHVGNKEIILGSVLGAKDGEKIEDYTIRYVSGDEKQGVFVLQKD